LRETLSIWFYPRVKINQCSQSAAKEIIQMNKSLAYIIGSFLGDGSIASDKRTFTLQAIDKDFVEKVKVSLSNLSENSVQMTEIPRKTTANNLVYGIYLSDIKLVTELLTQTNKRQNLPIDFKDWKPDLQKELISGLLDSEGYVSMTRVHSYHGQPVFDMKIGIGACDLWIYELHRFCQEQGIKVGQVTRELLKSGKIFAKFIFNKQSFIDYGLYFNIFRKQQRIENYKLLFPGSTTTRGIPKTEETKLKMSAFANSRIRVKGKFLSIGNDIV